MSRGILTKHHVPVTEAILKNLNISESEVFGTAVNRLGHPLAYRGKCSLEYHNTTHYYRDGELVKAPEISVYVGYKSEWTHPPYNAGEGNAYHRYLAEISNIPSERKLVAERIA